VSVHVRPPLTQPDRGHLASMRVGAQNSSDKIRRMRSVHLLFEACYFPAPAGRAMRVTAK
jgi:hypothetical protein